MKLKRSGAGVGGLRLKSSQVRAKIVVTSPQWKIGRKRVTQIGRAKTLKSQTRGYNSRRRQHGRRTRKRRVRNKKTVKVRIKGAVSKSLPDKNSGSGIARVRERERATPPFCLRRSRSGARSFVTPSSVRLQQWPLKLKQRNSTSLYLIHQPNPPTTPFILLKSLKS